MVIFAQMHAPPMTGWRATGLTYELAAVRGASGRPAQKMVALSLEMPTMVKPGGRKRKLVPGKVFVFFNEPIVFDAWVALSAVWREAGCEVNERPRASTSGKTLVMQKEHG